MQIRLITLGEKPPKWVVDGFCEYQKRLKPNIKLDLLELPIAKRTKTGNHNVWLEQEAKKINDKLKANNYLIILDVKSKLTSTEDLAVKLDNWKNSHSQVSILIGGPDGIDDSIKSRANEKISISKMTFPHHLVKVIIAEQLYRANAILNNHPYHK